VRRKCAGPIAVRRTLVGPGPPELDFHPDRPEPTEICMHERKVTYLLGILIFGAAMYGMTRSRAWSLLLKVRLWDSLQILTSTTHQCPSLMSIARPVPVPITCKTRNSVIGRREGSGKTKIPIQIRCPVIRRASKQTGGGGKYDTNIRQ
jgi:hypothetical protein